MKVYIKALVLFIITFSVGVAFRQYLQTFITENHCLKICFMSFLAVSFSLLIYLFKKGNWNLFTPVKWKKKYGYLIFILIILFGGNNYFQAIFDWESYRENLKSSLLGLVILHFIISSTSEEIIYRGFLQPFINVNTQSNSSAISKGNIFATILFFMTHLGFFTIMNPVFAVTSLINVIVYSLIAGYLFDRTKNIFIPIIVHISINLLHVFIQIAI